VRSCLTVERLTAPPMPIYEYRCAACRRRTSVFVRSITSRVQPRCERCGSARMTRLMSTFSVHRAAASDGDDDLGPLEDVDEGDPKSVARWARRMKEEMGEDLGPEFDDMVDRIEAGEDPDDVMAGYEDGGGLDDDIGDEF
jgi:putative FmdB family regulatory protein